MSAFTSLTIAKARAFRLAKKRDPAVRDLILMLLALTPLCGVQADDGELEKHTLVLPYRAFGIPYLATELIGREYWQWESDPDPDQLYPINVVVYRDLPLNTVKEAYPVDPKSEMDYRYVDHLVTADYFDKVYTEISVMEREGLVLPELNTTVDTTYHQITKRFGY